MEFLLILLPLLLEFLPLIIDKPAAERKKAFLRRMVRYEALAADATASVQERFAFGELAELCSCCAGADDEGLAKIQSRVGTACGNIQTALAKGA